MPTGRRIMIACEIGQGTGQRDRLRPVAAGLRHRGHEVVLVVRDPPAWRPDPALQAPAWRVAPPPGYLASSYADILLHAGYATPEALRGVLAGWLALLRDHRPDLLLAEFAPSAMLAARIAAVPTAVAGDGYSIPPATEPLPSMRPWSEVSNTQLVEAEGRVLPVINAELHRLGGAPLPNLAALLTAAAVFLCTFPELDHYPARGAADYYGAVFDPGAAAAPAQAAGTPPRVLVQIDARRPLLSALVEGLREMGLPATIQADRISASRAAALSRGSVRIAAAPLDWDAALADCTVLACEETSLVAPALLAGKPVLLLPLHVEQMMALHRVAGLGFGAGIPPEADATAISTAFRQILQDTTCHARVAGFARSYAGYHPAMATDAMIEACTDLLTGS